MTDTVRLLGKTGGYTDKPSRAMDPAEPEAVAPSDLAKITAASAASWPHLNALQVGARAAAPISTRIERCRQQARHLGVDVHGELRLIRLTIANGRSAASVERRVEVLENRLWPTATT